MHDLSKAFRELALQHMVAQSDHIVTLFGYSLLGTKYELLLCCTCLSVLFICGCSVFALVMEYAPHGNLRDVLRSGGLGRIDEKMAAMLQVFVVLCMLWCIECLFLVDLCWHGGGF